MKHRPRCLPIVAAPLLVTACALYFPPTPVLPQKFEGPLSAVAESLVTSTIPHNCAPSRHLDFGTTPQGCVRDGDVPGWVNWKGAAQVVKVGREWIQPDVAAALEVGRSMEAELIRRLGPPVVCHYSHQWTTREVRWIATEPSGVSTALIVLDNVPKHTATPRVILMRILGPEGCGHHNDRPFTH